MAIGGAFACQLLFPQTMRRTLCRFGEITVVVETGANIFSGSVVRTPSGGEGLPKSAAIVPLFAAPL